MFKLKQLAALVFLLNTSCTATLKFAGQLRPECLLLSICSIATAQIAAFNPELTHPQEDANKGPGHALAEYNPDIKLKQGEACTYSILGMYSWGDASIARAAKVARISHISTVDYDKTAVLAFVYYEFCTRVAGT